MVHSSNHRQEQTKAVDNFVELSTRQLNAFVSAIGWEVEKISSQSKRVVPCPFNHAHRVCEDNWVHFEKCQWRAEGYTTSDLPLSEPSVSTNNSSSAIRFDEQLQQEVLSKAQRDDSTLLIGHEERLIARTSDRLTANFTKDEKRAIYDYVISNTVKPDSGDDIAEINSLTQKSDNSSKISLHELLAQERNLKRRRAKHRGVHTNKKSQVEILREVISQQMEMYKEYLTDLKIERSETSSSSHGTTSKNGEGNDRMEIRYTDHEHRDRNVKDDRLSGIKSSLDSRLLPCKSETTLRSDRNSAQKSYSRQKSISDHEQRIDRVDGSCKRKRCEFTERDRRDTDREKRDSRCGKTSVDNSSSGCKRERKSSSEQRRRNERHCRYIASSHRRDTSADTYEKSYRKSKRHYK